MNRSLLLSALCLILSGCLVTSDSKTMTKGNYVPERVFDRIEPGHTSAAWVQATLGDPTSKTKVDATGSEIWKWNYTETKKGTGTVLFLFAGKSDDEKPHVAFVEMKNGVVTKKWRA